MSGRKLDLLEDCNDQRIPPKEFMGIFCKRCRNSTCVNSGWSESRWQDRISTQVDRLLTNVLFADPNDPNYKDIRALPFKEVAAPIYVIGGDPWAGPSVHFADPEKSTSQHAEVERAISALAETRGKAPPRAVVASEPVSPEVLLGTPEAEPRPNPSPASPNASPKPEAAPRPNPAHFRNTETRDSNTEFPAEGLMLDGSPPPPAPPPPSAGGPPPVDPWAAPTSPAPRRVPVGAKIKMGG